MLEGKHVGSFFLTFPRTLVPPMILADANVVPRLTPVLTPKAGMRISRLNSLN